MQLSLYKLKKAALAPRTAYMRRKEKDTDGIARTIFELHYYRKPVYDFIAATMANPDILVDVDIDESSTVIDAGAFNGDWSKKLWDRYQPNIYAFEPAPSGVKAMKKTFADEPRVQVFEYGLSAADEKASLALSGPGSSIYEDSGAFGSIDVEIRDVAAVFDELDLDEIDLLKVNIEGGEYDLFDRLFETGWMPRVRLVLIQFHEWHPKAYRRRREIRRALSRDHEEVWNYPWVWEYWRRIGG